MWKTVHYVWVKKAPDEGGQFLVVVGLIVV